MILFDRKKYDQQCSKVQEALSICTYYNYVFSGTSTAPLCLFWLIMQIGFNGILIHLQTYRSCEHALITINVRQEIGYFRFLPI